VIIYDFNVNRPFGGPYEANAPLIVDPYRMLSPAVTRESFQLIAWRRKKIG
jgi:hypothetical protein